MLQIKSLLCVLECRQRSRIGFEMRGRRFRFPCHHIVPKVYSTFVARIVFHDEDDFFFPHLSSSFICFVRCVSGVLNWKEGIRCGKAFDFFGHPSVLELGVRLPGYLKKITCTFHSL